jgi:2-keto-4-pentenoate hydratase
MDAGASARVAELLGRARLAAQPVPDIAASDEPQTVLDGYIAQSTLHRYLCYRTGSALAGWKIGATTADMQTYLGVDGPAYGRILSRNVHGNGAPLAVSDFCNPGIECEIALRIGTDADDTTYARDSIGQIIDTVLPAIEIVENRYGDFLARGTPTLIADDFFHKACVLGSPLTAWRDIDLAAVQGRTLIDGAEKGRGTGADVMGHPLEAVAWLANTLQGHGDKLRAGQVVLTGSVAPVIWIDRPAVKAEIQLERLGAVRVEIS